MRLWLLHPLAVHFPVALLVTGFALHARALYKGGGPPGGGGGEWTVPAARWLLWLGTAAAWAALGLGLLAEKTAPHVPSAWEVLAQHEELAWWTCGAFTAASLAIPRKPRWTAALWVVGLGLLFATARLGGQLVYDYNMGTKASEE